MTIITVRAESEKLVIKLYLSDHEVGKILCLPCPAVTGCSKP